MISGRTVEQLSRPEARANKEGRTGEVVPTPALQHDEASSKATDIAMVDPEVKQVADEGARANPQ